MTFALLCVRRILWRVLVRPRLCQKSGNTKIKIQSVAINLSFCMQFPDDGYMHEALIIIDMLVHP